MCDSFCARPSPSRSCCCCGRLTLAADLATPGRVALSLSSATPLSGATGYDAVRGLLSILAATAGSFADATESCLADDLAATSLEDDELPVEGDAFWYLVRAVDCGGPGTYDSASPGRVAGLRDPGIALSSERCP